MIDLDRANNLMAGVEYSSDGSTHRQLFDALYGQCEHLRRAGDTFVLPSRHAPYAWKQAWEIFERLRERENAPSNPAVVAAAQWQANVERRWTHEYLTNRGKFLELMRRGEITEPAARYIFRLRSGDLDSPVSSDPEAVRYGGRRLDWMEVSDRLSSAIGQWEAMTDDEKRTMPLAIAAARANEATAKLEARLAAIEAGGVPRASTNERNAK